MSLEEPPGLPASNLATRQRDGKLVINRKLNYAHARKSFPVASPNEFVLALGKVNPLTKFDKKNRTRNGSAVVDTGLKGS